MLVGLSHMLVEKTCPLLPLTLADLPVAVGQLLGPRDLSLISPHSPVHSLRFATMLGCDRPWSGAGQEGSHFLGVFWFPFNELCLGWGETT